MVKKWVYLIIGLVLIVNGMLAFLYASLFVALMQGMWGLVGVYLLWRSIKSFKGAKHGRRY